MGLRTWLGLKKRRKKKRKDAKRSDRPPAKAVPVLAPPPKPAAVQHEPPAILLESRPLYASQEAILELARQIVPRRAVGFEKVRIGRKHDGGYVMLDDFRDIAIAFSCGVGDDCSWDMDIASRSIPVQQFDHTIERSPADHSLITFHRLQIGATTSERSITIADLADRIPDGSTGILKMDIEGHEWEAVDMVPAERLNRFTQIVCEFHRMDLASDFSRRELYVRALWKLSKNFQSVHVHGNNAGSFVNIAGVVLPRTFEVTFANRSKYRFCDTDEIFPTVLDSPNLPNQPDLFLGSFKF